MTEIPCDDCSKPCGIFICTGCYEKVKTLGRVDGLKKALNILESREATAKALGCGDEFLAPFEQLKVFFNAAIWRLENPVEAYASRTILE